MAYSLCGHGIYVFRIIAAAQAFPGIDGMDVHQLHKTSDPLMVDFVTFISKHVLHALNTHCRMFQMVFVHKSHYFKVLFRFANRRVVQLTAVYFQQFALTPYAKPFVPFVHKLSEVYFRPAFLQALMKNHVPWSVRQSWPEGS